MTNNIKQLNNQFEYIIDILLLERVLKRDYTNNHIYLSSVYKEKLPELISYDFNIYEGNLLDPYRKPVVNHLKAKEVFHKVCVTPILFKIVKEEIESDSLCWNCGFDTNGHKYKIAQFNNGNSPVCFRCNDNTAKQIKQIEHKPFKFNKNKPKNHRDIIFNKWKNLNKLFYSRGKHVFRIYDDDTIELINFDGRIFNYEIINTQQQNSKLAFSIINRKSNKAGSLVLISNSEALLVFEGMKGYKFKK